MVGLIINISRPAELLNPPRMNDSWTSRVESPMRLIRKRGVNYYPNARPVDQFNPHE